jgi:hypothetical protein
MKATSKFDKSSIIDEILTTVRNNSRRLKSLKGANGGFIKKDEKTGQFYEVGDIAAVRTNIDVMHFERIIYLILLTNLFLSSLCTARENITSFSGCHL